MPLKPIAGESGLAIAAKGLLKSGTFQNVIGAAHNVISWIEKILDSPLFRSGPRAFTLLDLLRLLLLALVVVISERVLLRRVIGRILKGSRLSAGARGTLSRLAGGVFIGVGLYISLQYAPIDLQQLMQVPLIHLGGNPFTMENLVTLAVLIILIFASERLLRHFLIQRLLEHTHLDPPMRYALVRLTGYIYIGLGLYASLQFVKIDLSSLAVLAGAIGVGLGFGLQNIISNFVSGLIILAERPIALGDRIDVGGVVGRVTKISLRSTAVVTNDNITIIIPNSNFITNPVTNWSYGDPKVRLRLPIGVGYGSDMEKVRRVLIEMAAQHPKVLPDPPPDVFFIGFGDSSLNLELAVWAEDLTFQPRRLRSELNFAMDKTLRENNIEVPFPQRDLHVRSGALAAELSPKPQSAPADRPRGSP